MAIPPKKSVWPVRKNRKQGRLNISDGLIVTKKATAQTVAFFMPT
ncbi:hypothetical protein TW89_0349 [Neisseria flavescens]|nr:hypothetical protein TW89_0349 [Neisseria flavescens]